MEKPMAEIRTIPPLVCRDAAGSGPVHRLAMVAANGFVEHLLSIPKIRHIYESIPFCRDPFEFLKKVLEELAIEPIVNEREVRSIPASGPLVVVANHPFGGADGLVLASVLSAVRKDFKILANYFLASIPDLKPLLFSVDPFRKRTSSGGNAATMRKAVSWVRQGGALVVFPAGEVSHLTWRSRGVEDPTWSDAAVRLIQLALAQVLPVRFEGRNSNLFQIAGLIHPILRTIMLPRELLKKRFSAIKLRIGKPIPHQRFRSFGTAVDLRDYLRFRTDLLSPVFRSDKKPISFPLKPGSRSRRMRKVLPAQDPFLLRKEVESLPSPQRLIENGEFTVYWARADQIPRVLMEIGRLREETFRMAGEGTGKRIDLDRFDNIYTHLFVWNKEKDEVVGAYRLGPTDEILARHGKKGLYTHTLFDYEDKLLEEITPALEMGRTFVRKEYQRSYFPLLLLWKGIGHYVAAHPQYRILFGAVSISNDYHFFSRQLMVEFLKMNCSLQDLGTRVTPRRPFKAKLGRDIQWIKGPLREEDIEEVSAWVSLLEEDGKGVPILLKQYLKVGGKILSFSVDKRFGNVLDGLVLVDLTLTDQKPLRRYMGNEGFDSFMRYHVGSGSPAVSSPS